MKLAVSPSGGEQSPDRLASRGIRVIPMVPLLKRDVTQKSIDWADQLDADLQHGTHGMAVVTTAFNNAIR